MEENATIFEGHQFNLSDFALFLSVMKNPRAYRCVLSILMEEPNIELVDVKVEQVILNKSGKRAIRLDAWAKASDDRRFNMEMQKEQNILLLSVVRRLRIWNWKMELQKYFLI